MNKLSSADFRQSLLHHGRLRLRMFDWRRRAAVFSRSNESGVLRRIYVINLDRRPDRWKRVRRELDRFRDRHGERLSAIARRFSAVDSRYMEATPDPAVLIPRFTLADQLTVDPNPLLRIDDETRARTIEMTKQEVAVALSHTEVWKLIANGDVPSALVLEDDVFMTYGFARDLEATWSSLTHPGTAEPDFDLLYLAFAEVGNASRVHNGDGARRLQQTRHLGSLRLRSESQRRAEATRCASGLRPDRPLAEHAVRAVTCVHRGTPAHRATHR